MRSQLTDALGAYAQALRREPLSPALDARVARAIERWAAPDRRRRAQSIFETRLFAVAAALALVSIGGAYAWLRTVPDRAPRDVAATETLLNAPASYPPDVVPVQEVVLRVPTTLAGGVATAIPAVATTADELRFWVDVRIASDGSMRVVRVVPVDPSRR
jgi:hypothetical protein